MKKIGKYISALFITFLIVSNVIMLFSMNKISKGSGYYLGENVVVTGYDWLQLNNTSGNKIHLYGGTTIQVSSPSFQWNGDDVATKSWVINFCNSENGK